MTSLDWNLARAFCATAETGSLSAAARRLALTQPTLSRQVAALEEGLGVTLFERIGKRLALTEAGAALLDHARAMAAAADAMALAAQGSSKGTSGRVTISVTDVVSVWLMPEIVAAIRARAPDITLVIAVSNDFADLRRREADIAIRHARPSEPDLIGRRLDDMVAHVYASDVWIAANGLPEGPRGLAAADVLAIEPADRFAAHLVAAGLVVAAEDFRIRSQNGVVLWEMVRRGLGAGVMLAAIAARTPCVRRILPDMPPTPVPVWLVSHRELRTSARVRLVFDLVADAFARIAQEAASGTG